MLPPSREAASTSASTEHKSKKWQFMNKGFVYKNKNTSVLGNKIWQCQKDAYGQIKAQGCDTGSAHTLARAF
jgi:hypothetical protein